MNRWFWLGSLTLMIGGVAHFVVVDLSVMILEADYVHWLPVSLLSQLKSTVIDWGLLFFFQSLYYGLLHSFIMLPADVFSTLTQWVFGEYFFFSHFYL